MADSRLRCPPDWSAGLSEAEGTPSSTGATQAGPRGAMVRSTAVVLHAKIAWQSCAQAAGWHRCRRRIPGRPPQREQGRTEAAACGMVQARGSPPPATCGASRPWRAWTAPGSSQLRAAGWMPAARLRLLLGRASRRAQLHVQAPAAGCERARPLPLRPPGPACGRCAAGARACAWRAHRSLTRCPCPTLPLGPARVGCPAALLCAAAHGAAHACARLARWRMSPRSRSR